MSSACGRYQGHCSCTTDCGDVQLTRADRELRPQLMRSSWSRTISIEREREILTEVAVNCKALLMTAAVMMAVTRPGSAQEALPQQADEKTPATGTDSERAWRLSWDNRPSLRYGDLLRLDFRARVTGDLRSSEASLRDSDTSRFDIARRRIGVTGEIASVADF